MDRCHKRHDADRACIPYPFLYFNYSPLAAGQSMGGGAQSTRKTPPGAGPGGVVCAERSGGYRASAMISLMSLTAIFSSRFSPLALSVNMLMQ